MSVDDVSKLIADAVAGDSAALERLLVSNSARLSRHIVRKFPSVLAGRDTTEDILQQTYVRAIRGINQFEGTTERALMAWLSKIAENQIHNAVVAHQRKKRSGGRHRIHKVGNAQTSSLVDIVEMLTDEEDTPGRAAARVESICAVQVAIAALPKQQRRAIELRYLNGRTVAEAAAELDRSPGAVNALLNRAKQKLRDSLRRSSKWSPKKG